MESVKTLTVCLNQPPLTFESVVLRLELEQGLSSSYHEDLLLYHSFISLSFVRQLCRRR